ncbi:MAG TPA: membrane protein insertase YidC, partial [Microthrixaceae bacterium]|nr:membrane protein insertase YidC [Microthrixaceae bacterium]
MFDGFLEFVAGILNWFYSLIPNYGVAIGLLTLSVMIVITPLTLKSTRAMIQMQRLQPQLKKLQEQYKGDRERLNTELMAFYKEHDLNPLSGCVPVVAQLPIFIILYNVLRGLTNRVGGAGSGIGHVAGQIRTEQSFTPWILHDQPFDPQHLAESSQLYQALSNTNKMNFLGMDLSISPLDALRIGILTAIPFLILMGLLLASQIIQNRQIQGRNKNAQQNMPSQQQAIMKFLPFMLPVFSFTFPAGLAYYYFIQGLCRMGTQAYITRRFYGEDATSTVVIDTSASEKAAATGSKGDGAQGAIATKSDSKPPPGAAKSTQNGATKKKPGTSAKSQAAQKKATGGQSAGRRSGAP